MTSTGVSIAPADSSAVAQTGGFRAAIPALVSAACRLDSRILLEVARRRTPAATRFMRMATRLGDTATWIWLGVVLLSFDGAAGHAGKLLATAALVATAVAQVVKRLLRRPRPSARLEGFSPLVENPDAFSFPSGHTAAAFAVAVAFAGGAPGVALLFLGAAVLIASSRVYLGAHYPLDVAVGAVIGGLSGVVAIALGG